MRQPLQVSERTWRGRLQFELELSVGRCRFCYFRSRRCELNGDLDALIRRCEEEHERLHEQVEEEEHEGQPMMHDDDVSLSEAVKNHCLGNKKMSS